MVVKLFVFYLVQVNKESCPRNIDRQRAHLIVEQGVLWR